MPPAGNASQTSPHPPITAVRILLRLQFASSWDVCVTCRDENVLKQLPTLKNWATSHKILNVWLLSNVIFFSCFIQVLLWFFTNV